MNYRLSVPAIYQQFADQQPEQFQTALWNNLLLNIADKKEITTINRIFKDYQDLISEAAKNEDGWKEVSYMLPIALLSLDENEGYSLVINYLAIDTRKEKAPVFEIEIHLDIDYEGSGHFFKIKSIATSWLSFFRKLKFVKSELELQYARINKVLLSKDGQGKYLTTARKLSKDLLIKYNSLPAKEKNRYAKLYPEVEALYSKALKGTALESAKTRKEANVSFRQAFDQGDIEAGWPLVKLLTNKNDQRAALVVLDKLRRHPSQKKNLYTIWLQAGIAAIKGNYETEAKEAYQWLYKQAKGNPSKINSIRNVLKRFSTHHENLIAKKILDWFI